MLKMSLITKLLEVWTVSKTFSAATALLMRLIAGVATIIICVLVAVILVSVLLIGGILVAYRQLVITGMDPQMAALTIGGVLIVALIAVLLYARKHLNQLRLTSKSLVDFKTPGTDHLVRIMDAFMKGFEHPGKAE